MNNEQLMRFVAEAWDKSIVPALCEYIRIPNKSAHFDKDWEKHGHMDAAAELMRQWCEANALPGMKTEIVRLPGRTPLLFIDVPASGEKNSSDCVLMYGHMDKQPEFTGWAEGLSPWTPVIRNGRLYGRGGADDGYAVFGSLLALKALADQNIPHARCVILIEGSEESGSPDLPAYVDALADRIGDPSLVVCLDAECGNYDQFWCTTSLRGNLTGTLRVDVLREGVHSGMASGIAASSMRIARQVLDRVEDSATGRIKLDALFAKIPEDRVQQAQAAAKALGTEVYRKLPMVEGMQPMDKDPAELLLNSTWRPTLSTTGVDGIPSLPNAGNVLRPYTAFKLSFRIPPGVDPERAGAAIKEALEKDPPYGAKVRYEADPGADGWNAPSTAPWLAAAMSSASKNFFGKDAMYMGVGGTIPFMGMLNVKFPKTQFLVTGVLGPQSNAHGPNEFLDIETGKKVTACVAQVVAEHYRRS
ncbi:M20 family metallopeptidase [Peristeroidobacter soli]|jgi:acetylornithine deacetylase/succinyl-diaminopimelate desuccinylase-like protein|uniref:M20 family metallopeptidase n=1 Tax=Peristeroidobacter soli TaxID=2497877 RepID=UPI00101DFE6F|nr:M20 family metallopeptidase [Peristeroidobacter soli]